MRGETERNEWLEKKNFKRNKPRKSWKNIIENIGRFIKKRKCITKAKRNNARKNELLISKSKGIATFEINLSFGNERSITLEIGIFRKS
jgi:hypothetical protein